MAESKVSLEDMMEPEGGMLSIISGVLIILLVALPLRGPLQLWVISSGLVLIGVGIMRIILAFIRINNMR
ncbi:MAG: hypothetical protein QXS81_04965 [Candidatus Micrarchaeaceae archaeon]